LFFTFIYGVWYYLKIRSFKENISLFIPDNQSQKPLEPLNVNVEGLSLKVCLYYRNGSSLSEIQKNLGLKYPQEAKRKLIEGLGILLKSYGEKHD
jgi:hypothetical protein